MTQSNLNNWDVVNQQINLSKIKRINYKEIFGKSLTEKITELKVKGIKSAEAIKILNDEAIKNGYIDISLFNRIKISVCSRYAEQGTAIKRLKIK